MERLKDKDIGSYFKGGPVLQQGLRLGSSIYLLRENAILSSYKVSKVMSCCFSPDNTILKFLPQKRKSVARMG
jgi:hypothetical protein